jgi:hypothetical protein
MTTQPYPAHHVVKYDCAWRCEAAAKALLQVLLWRRPPQLGELRENGERLLFNPFPDR